MKESANTGEGVKAGIENDSLHRPIATAGNVLRILFTSYVFSPDIGGIETVSALIATEFARAGHEVILVTKTAKQDGISWPFKVIRDPSPLQLVQLTKWSQVVFQNNISLALAWPLLLISRPWIISHHTWLGHLAEKSFFRTRLKTFLLRFATNITISRAVSETLPCPSQVAGNPYASNLFHAPADAKRDREFIFLGRLVSDKGVDLLLNAMAELGRRGLHPRLTIVGTGPETGPLQAQASALGIAAQVDFAGSRTGTELAHILQRHQTMVIPSRWIEPFGVVALEGIASGCAIVASNQGGLPDAVGACGLFFESGDANSLADQLERVLREPDLHEAFLRERPAHLKHFAPPEVASRILRLVAEAHRQHSLKA